MSAQVRRRFIWAGVALLTVLMVGSIGYWFIGGRQHSFIDVLYMTIITISTIGFTEIVDMSANPAGRVFTIFIALCGIGTFVYIITNVTALAVEGELRDTFRRRRMEKKARNSKGHFIVCGVGWVGSHIVNELCATQRPYVIVDINKESIEKVGEDTTEEIIIEGDATENDTLLKAGIEQATGVFAVTGDDNHNLVISLTAKQLNPGIKVVARCNETSNEVKMRKAGADAVVSPGYIGGLRMASEMIRPTVVSFLDIMLRDRDSNLRIEEVSIPDSLAGTTILDLELAKYPHTLLLAIRMGEEWVYNPPVKHIITPGSTLVFMTTPEDRSALEKAFQTA
ncbi:MAG: potassium channel protein [Dehalococcoidales bacterium]|nr:MAG: potassium channel protein [Dehalococcoidales bacterium]